MTCYKSTNLPSGVTTTGRSGYATEAECLQACKEGACCDGATCTVKPQCQCQCKSGSCCGPDTVTLSGITGPTCRGGTKAECDARGGTWRDCVGCTADAANPSVAIRPCQPTDGANVRVPVFKGVGTTCAGNPCGCCCVNGVATTKTEQECAAAGGTWKQYSCNSPVPSSVILTLSLTNYSQYLSRSPTTTSPGTWNFDFSCVRTSYTLSPSFNYTYANTSTSLSIWPAATFYPSGSLAGGPFVCGCQTPIFNGGTIQAVESAVATRSGYTQASSINCNAGMVDASNAWVFELVPNGISPDTFPRSIPVPGFCTGSFFITGHVYGPGQVACGTFTLGNPLP